MNIYTYSAARQNLASLLDEASKTGKVIIKRKDGSIFEVSPAKEINSSPLDVPGISINTDQDEINSILKEIRER
ncbi:MAG: hypothetical protein SCALA702_25020 [Melioribacteraceae bacterium]|nr:MAG: hypothetical protein SCALA702_25020 [Melioribacteraceae bacterium]